MSFTKTISTVAALASIFGAAAAGWKLADSNSTQPPTALDQKIEQLDQKLETLTKQEVVEIPVPSPVEETTQVPLTPVTSPVTLPSQPTQTQTQALPPPPPAPPHQ